MGIHRIRDTKIDFHSGTSEAQKYLEDELSSSGFKELLNKAEKEGTANFSDLEERKYKLLFDQDGGWDVERRS